MATKQPPVGIDHPTVVPTNYDPDDAGADTDEESGDDTSADDTL